MNKKIFKKSFLRKLIFPEKNFFGLDFNNSNLKVLSLCKKGDEDKVLGWGEKKIPKGIIEAFEIKNKDVFREVFEDLLKQMEGKLAGSAIVSVPESKVFIRVVQMPLMKEEEIEKAIKWETENNIPVSIESVYYDWQILEKREKDMNVLVVAVGKKIIDNYLEVFDYLGIDVAVFEPESIATGRSLLNEESGCLAILDIGKETSSLAFYKNSFPIFTTSYSISGDSFTDLAAKFLRVDHQEAESYKSRVGLGRNLEEKKEAYEIFSPALDILVKETQRAIDFFNNNLKETCARQATVNKIIVCGGGSNLAGLMSFLAINLKIEVFQYNPWAKVILKNSLPPISKEKSQSFSTVIGLALRNLI